MDALNSTSQPYSPGLLEVLPYVAPPLLIIIGFSCPPFPGRGITFAIFIILTDYATIISPWPPNLGSARSMRYGLAGSWIFVLPAIEKLLLHVPERDFWRVDDEKAIDKGRPQERSWSKVRWAVAMAITPRGVGWNFGSRKVNAARRQMKQKGIKKGKFVGIRLVRAALAYLALDAVVLAASKAPIPNDWAWNWGTIGKIAYIEWLMGVSVYSTMTLQFEIVAAIAVGLKLTQPEEWPPLFGNILACYTVGNVWGEFWHSYTRQPVLGLSHAMVSFLRIPRKSTLAYLVHLTTAFSISAFFHILSLSVICPGYLPLKRLTIDMALFFMAQPPVTIAAALVPYFYEKAMSSGQVVVDQRIEKDGIQSSYDFQKAFQVSGKLFGYLSVLFWFILSGWWFVQPYVVLGVVEWPLPFSFWSYFN
ncbi:Fc.00g105260.m01.CDS01 [Cosmosporella sp. VM-42]